MLPWRSLSRWAWPSGLFALIMGTAIVGAMEPSWLGPRGRITVPLYARDSTQPVGVLRAERLRPDYERRGFFRIGVLPMLVAEEVTLEAQRVSDGARMLRQAALFLQANGAERKLELRKVTCRFAGETPIELQCGRLVPTADGWLATGGVRWEGGGIQRAGQSARIQTDRQGGWCVIFEPSAESRHRKTE
jgi:hypothetical protein